MHTKWQRLFSIPIILIFGSIALFSISASSRPESIAFAQTSATPIPAVFDQKAAVAKLREQIKGHENDPTDKVFKNIQMLKTFPASRLLAVMEFGYARSLGVDCTHCHVPDKWESEEKPQKQIARDMFGMMGKINGELLKNIKNLKSATPTVNCTTCHRGEVTPAVNLPAPPKA
jgi:hypothetical protein